MPLQKPTVWKNRTVSGSGSQLEEPKGVTTEEAAVTIGENLVASKECDSKMR